MPKKVTKTKPKEEYLSQPLDAVIESLKRLFKYSTKTVFQLIGVLVLVVVALVAIFMFVVSQTNTQAPTPLLRLILLLALAGYIITVLAISIAQIRLVIDAIQNRPSKLIPLLKLGFSKLLPVLGLFILMGIFIIAGLILFILPGLYILVRLAYAPFILLNENKNIFDSLRQSFELTKGHFWETAGAMATPSVLSNIVTALMFTILVNLVTSGAPATIPLLIVMVLISLIVGLLANLASLGVTAFRYHQISLARTGKLETPEAHPLNYVMMLAFLLVALFTQNITQQQSIKLQENIQQSAPSQLYETDKYY